MNGVWLHLGQGALAGAAATGFMSLVMVIGKRFGHFHKHAPQKITDRSLESMGVTLPAKTRRPIALGAHFAFGAGAGAAFSLMQGRLPVNTSKPLPGLAYGLLIWALSYKGWVPALGILPPPEADQRGRAWTMFLAHVVYGTSLAAMNRPMHRLGSIG